MADPGWYPAVDPGWYPVPGGRAYWDGQAWTSQYVADPPPQIVVNVGAGHKVTSLSGMSTGGHIVHGLLTVLTCGLWAPIWWLRWRLRRRAIR